MRRDYRTGIEVSADIGEFDAAQAFARDVLERTSVSREIARETMVVFETVFSAVLMQGIESSSTLNISAENRLSGINLKISYEGKRFSPEESADGLPLELRLLEGYADKVSHSYHSGYNIIRVSVQKRQRAHLVLCVVGALASIAVYTIINALIGREGQQAILNDYVLPLEQLYANAMLMVGAPVTFFSLMKNASDAVVVSERLLNARKLHVKSIVTSAFAIVLAFGLSVVVALLVLNSIGYDTMHSGRHVEWSFAEMVVQMVPASIFEPFEAISPIPLIVVALLVTYALVSAGKDFDVLKRAIDVCYGLFSRMLSAVIAILPIATFLAMLDILLKGGYVTLLSILSFVLFAVASTSVLLATYAIRLMAKGVRTIPFVKKLMPLLKENIIIGSAIDAAPYNVRYCAKHYGIDRKRLSRTLQSLAQVNRDGNCFLLTLVAMLYIFASGTDISMVNIAVVAAMALFLSFGAPNQPGSILIGTLIIVVNYLSASDMICMAICLEVFLGSVQNIINVIGDIVMMMEEEIGNTNRLSRTSNP